MMKLKILDFGFVLIFSMSFAPTAMSDLRVGAGGGGACFPVISEITHNWSQVKRYMLPNRGKLRRAKDKDFYCVAAQYTRDMMERNVSRSLDLRCYRDPSGSGMDMCCDRELNACAKLRPDSIDIPPRQVAEKKTDAEAKPPSSSWVRPPTEADQWKTPED